MSNRYIGPGEYDEGQIGFLIEHSNPVKRSETWSLSDLPAHTNQSHEPRLHGWCGSWNDTSTNARGVWRVVKVLPNGRAKIEELVGEELATALEELGYPELTPSEVCE
jgi:hypothetical protein